MRAYDQFIPRNFDAEGLGGTDALQKRVAIADALNDREYVDGDDHVGGGTLVAGGKVRRKTLARSEVLDQLRRMRNHEVYTGGLQLASYESGLAFERVGGLQSNVHIAEQVDAFFQYDSRPVKNPKASVMKPFRVCAERSGGVLRDCHVAEGSFQFDVQLVCEIQRRQTEVPFALEVRCGRLASPEVGLPYKTDQSG